MEAKRNRSARIRRQELRARSTVSGVTLVIETGLRAFYSKRVNCRKGQTGLERAG